MRNLVYGFFCATAVLPLWILYCVSDISYFVVYRIIRYRRDLVRRNLTNSFPEKTAAEIIEIEKGFYHHFCDVFFETIKILNFSASRMKRHFAFKNDELLEYFLNEGRPVILYIGHYGNWEWTSSIPLWIEPDDSRLIGHVYRPLKNKNFDSLFLRLREKFRCVMFNKYTVYRDLMHIKRDGKNWLLCFAADQKPSPAATFEWTIFLNQPTAMLTGTAKLAKRTNAVICYLEVTKTKRSFYEGKIKLITDNPSELSEAEITEKYLQLLERNIMKNPSYYLWTHRRWKYVKPKE